MVLKKKKEKAFSTNGSSRSIPMDELHGTPQRNLRRPHMVVDATQECALCGSHTTTELSLEDGHGANA